MKGNELVRNIYENEPASVDELNPWTAIWSTPRKAIRSAINYPNTKLVMILVIVAGIINILDRAVGENLGDTMPFILILLLALVGGAIGGLIGWWILAGLMTFIGKLFGGLGTYKEMKIAVGISYIPMALSGIVYIFDVLFLGSSLFMDVEISVFQVIWLLFSSSIGLVLSFWSLFILIKGIAEVHRFSSWKGLLTLLIPLTLLIFLVLSILFFAVIIV